MQPASRPRRSRRAGPGRSRIPVALPERGGPEHQVQQRRAEQRGDGEDSDRAEDDAPATEAHAASVADRQHQDKAERVGGDRPAGPVGVVSIPCWIACSAVATIVESGDIMSRASATTAKTRTRCTSRPSMAPVRRHSEIRPSYPTREQRRLAPSGPTPPRRCASRGCLSGQVKAQTPSQFPTSSA